MHCSSPVLFTQCFFSLLIILQKKPLSQIKFTRPASQKFKRQTLLLTHRIVFTYAISELFPLSQCTVRIGLLYSLTVTGSSSGVSISACRRNTFPLHTLHSILSKAGIFSRTITPATNLSTQLYAIGSLHYRV